MKARLVFVGWLAGCGAANAPVPSTNAGPRPSDPAPYASSPSFEAEPDEVAVALRLSTGHEQARAVAVGFIEDALRGDEAAVASRFADRVAHLRPRIGPRVESRRAFIDTILRYLQSHGGPSGDEPADWLETDRLTVEPLEHVLGDEPVPTGLEPTDLLVRIPFAMSSHVGLRGAFASWTEELILLVRPGPEPLIVGL